MLLLPFHTLPLQASSQRQYCHLGGERRRLENFYAKPTARAAPWHTHTHGIPSGLEEVGLYTLDVLRATPW